MGFALVCLGAAFRPPACTTLAVFAGVVGPLAALLLASILDQGFVHCFVGSFDRLKAQGRGLAHPATREQESRGNS